MDDMQQVTVYVENDGGGGGGDAEDQQQNRLTLIPTSSSADDVQQQTAVHVTADAAVDASKEEVYTSLANVNEQQPSTSSTVVTAG